MCIVFFPHKCAGTHSLSLFLCCCLGAEHSRLLPVTCHCHPSPSPVTITCHRHPLLNSLSPMSNPSLLATELLLPVKGAKTLHLSPSPLLPEFVIAAMLDKSMMKLNNENYEIWKILMEAILVRKQLRDVALGWMPRPARPPNAMWAWDRKNQEARAKLQLAVKWDQLAHMTVEDASEIWAELERVHRLTRFTTHIGLK